MSNPALVSALARSLLAGQATVEAVRERAIRTLGRPWAWLHPMSVRYVETFGAGTRPRHREVVAFLLRNPDFRRARADLRHPLAVVEWLHEPARMHPVATAKDWDLPVIETTGELARWMSLHPAELEWFADLKGLCGKQSGQPLAHYVYRVLPKRTGGVRLIESPKRQLKELQRRILSLILDRIPAHPAAHGFVKGRSIAGFAAPHTGKSVVLRLDLENFFPAFPRARAQALFRTLGYPEPVADRLGGICSNAAPREIWNRCPLEINRDVWLEARTLYSSSHLPQGAPTSPALANAAAFHLDSRLAGLAKYAGAVYTRYADDLAFSGGEDFSRGVERFSLHAAAVALEEGFGINHHKTRIMRQGTRQMLSGLVVNRKLSLRRKEVEKLEAILTNCVRTGPQSQNRANHPDFRAQLEGKIGYVEMIDRAKGQMLRKLFKRIEFDTRQNRAT